MSWRDSTLDRIGDSHPFVANYAMDSDEEREERKRYADSEWMRRDDSWRQMAPTRFADASPDDLDGPALDAFTEWRADATSNLLVFGPVGTGKSHFAYALARHAFMCGIRVKCSSVIDMLNALRPEGGGHINHYAGSSLLVLDDLGTEKMTDWAAEQVNGIIDARWRDRLGTIVTSNLSPQQLKETLGERAWSRLQDGAIALTLTGSDRRRQAA